MGLIAIAVVDFDLDGFWGERDGKGEDEGGGGCTVIFNGSFSFCFSFCFGVCFSGYAGGCGCGSCVCAFGNVRGCEVG
jgi:hypothetical protein